MPTPSARRYCSIVCPNGLGHLRRTIGILSRVMELDSAAQLDLVCKGDALSRLRGWPRATGLLGSPRVRVHSGIVDDLELQPPTEGSRREQDLVGWIDRLADTQLLASADVVTSDNLGGTLALRPDAVLLGSFLWSDILGGFEADSSAIAKFCENERALLSRHRPPMLCVDDVAMPALTEWTTRVGLPWMCEEALPARLPQAQPPEVAILVGDTGQGRSLLPALTTGLEQLQSVRMTLPERNQTVEASLPAFDYSDRAFSACAAIVCRPGMGTVSDCIGHAVPMLLAHEPANPEMQHIGSRLHALGLGRYIGVPTDPEILAGAIRELLDPETNAAMRRRMASTRRDGLSAAAAWLVEYR